MNTAITPDDVALGQKVVGHALQALALGSAIALAWSASTVMMTIALSLAWWIATSLIAMLVHMCVMHYTSEESFAKLGASIGSVTGRISGLFAKKVAA